MEEEDDVAVAAANILIWMSRAKVEKREANKLEKIKQENMKMKMKTKTKMKMKMKMKTKTKMKRKVNAGITIKDNNNPEPAALNTSVDGTPLPRYPPIPFLEGKIDLRACSMPFEKQLTTTDVKEEQNRLALIKDEVIRSILPLLERGEDLYQGVPVTTYNPEGREYEMTFKSWSENKFYILNGEWKRFFRENGLLERKHWVTVWMFRHSQTRKLCFALTWKFIPLDK